MTRSILSTFLRKPGICIPDWKIFWAVLFAFIPVVSTQNKAKIIPPMISIAASRPTCSNICQIAGTSTTPKASPYWAFISTNF